MKFQIPLLAALLAAIPLPTSAQVNSGSDGSDGVLDPASDLVIDMADHPDGIYQYTSVNIRFRCDPESSPSGPSAPTSSVPARNRMGTPRLHRLHFHGLIVLFSPKVQDI